MRVKSRIAVALTVIAALTALLGACGSDSDSGSDGRVTLVIGDQVKSTQSLLEAAGELKDTPYDIEWATFESGPPLLEAASAGKIDFGGTGDVPPVLAQANGAKVKIVGVQARDAANDFLLVPNSSSATSITDLKGKKIAVAQGSSSHGLLLGLLGQAGLTADDVKLTFLSPTEALSAFSAGQVDAWAVWNPYAAVAQGKANAKPIANSGGITTQQAYYLASEEALGNDAKSKALADLVGRVNRAQLWAVDHQAEWVPIYAGLTKLPEDVANATFDTSKGPLVPIGPEQIAKQQKLADLFYDGGQIKKEITAADYFDDRYNADVTAPVS